MQLTLTVPFDRPGREIHCNPTNPFTGACVCSP